MVVELIVSIVPCLYAGNCKHSLFSVKFLFEYHICQRRSIGLLAISQLEGYSLYNISLIRAVLLTAPMLYN